MAPNPTTSWETMTDDEEEEAILAWLDATGATRVTEGEFAPWDEMNEGD